MSEISQFVFLAGLPNQIKVFLVSNHKTANRLVGVITILELDNINSTDKENC